jgi:hypothetical protein
MLGFLGEAWEVFGRFAALPEKKLRGFDGRVHEYPSRIGTRNQAHSV